MLFHKRATLAALVAVLLLQGCAELTHLTRTRSLPDGVNKSEVILVDAKQRSILTVRTTAPKDGSNLRVCAEPSPDALSALATSSGLSLSKSDALKLASNFSLAEGAGSIGLRTQSIQLMRDAMYRLCEGYLSGAIDGPAFETLHRRFQSSMVAILAIEQLTGVVRPPTVVLGGNATAGDAERAADLTEKTEAALQDLRSSEKTFATKQAVLNTATLDRVSLDGEKAALEKQKAGGKQLTPAETERLSKLPDLIENAKKTEKEAKTAATDAEKVKNDRQASYDRLDSARQAALAGGGNSAVQASVPNISGVPAGGLSNENAALIASTVQHIVASTLELSFGRELCTTVLLKTPPNPLGGTLYEKCVSYLNETVEALKQTTATKKELSPVIAGLIAKVTTKLANVDGNSADTLKAVNELIRDTKVLNPDKPILMSVPPLTQ